ncbi:hypothetical protein [Klebsiella variicola]|uniref:hypothetical protein n=1 Tax=Klebsiella variicola TaxID=244366 RepID=UPI00101CF412|nr:hypothetical protein [Klebsiella variicola]
MNEVTKSLYAGWQDKLEADRVDCIILRAQKFCHGYLSAKQAFKTYEAEYSSNGIVRLHVDKYQLYGISELKTFKQTGWHSYTHYLEVIGMYIGSAIGDKSYLSMNVSRMAGASSSLNT